MSSLRFSMRSTNSIRIFKDIFHPLPYCVTGDDCLQKGRQKVHHQKKAITVIQLAHRCAFLILCSCLFLRVGSLRTHRSECVPSHSFRSRSGHVACGKLESSLKATESPEISHRSPMVFPKPASRFSYTKGILRVYKRQM